MDTFDIIFRLGAAALIGGAVGLNRDLHRKPSGLRTLSLVGLGSALAVLAAAGDAPDPNAVSRVLQGLLTGIGFLGAGVIVRDASSNKVHGLTTAAAIWLTACLGAVCGLGAWRLVIVACVILAIVLVVGGRFEKAVHKRLSGDATNGDGHD